MEDSYHHHHHHSRHGHPPTHQHQHQHQSNIQQTLPPAPYFRPPYHPGPPMHGLHLGRPIPNSPQFGVRELFNGGAPPLGSLLTPRPSLHHHRHPRMSWPNEEGWRMHLPLVGGHHHHHRSMNFPGPHEAYLPPDFTHQQGNRGNRQTMTPLSGGSEVPVNFSTCQINGGDQFKEEWPPGVFSGRKVGGSPRNEHLNGSSQFIGGSSDAMHRSKRMRTQSQNLSKHRAPLRPLVTVNKDLKSKHSTHVSMVTYNLLAQDLIEKNMFLYSHCSSEELMWEFRIMNLVKELIDSDADILCLQEVQEEHYQTWLHPQLIKHGYSGIFKKRTGTHKDGCAIFYIDSKLKLLGWNGLEYQRQIKVLNRDNVALLAKFTLAKDGDSAVFCVANTHLLFNPKAGEVKLAQLCYLLTELHKMALKPGTDELTPVLLCGDFNSTPNSSLLNFITSSALNYSKLSALDISGYFEDRRKSRIIPIPLFPEEMNITANCVYSNTESGGGGGKDKSKSTSSDAVGEGVVSKDSKQAIGSSIAKVHSDKCDQKSAVGPPPTVRGHTELSSVDIEGLSNRPMKSTRSVRGSKTRGYGAVNVSDFRSLLGSTSTSKRGREQSEYLSADDLKGPLSGGSSVDDFVMEKEPNLTSRCSNSRGSYAEDSAIDSLESSLSSISKNTLSSSSDSKNKKTTSQQSTETVSKRIVCNKPSGILTHPFKLVSAYPHSKTLPSTVTTYHQRAFETVDYIFYSPVTYQACGSKTKLSGFNLLKRKVLPSTHTLLDLGPQPHSFLSSDHLLLQTTFQFSW